MEPVSLTMEDVTPPPPATPLQQHPVYEALDSQYAVRQPPLEIPGKQSEEDSEEHSAVQQNMAVTGDETHTATASDLSVGHQQNPEASSSYLGGAGTSACNSKQPPDAAVHKKQIRLLKNREAAKECRRKKKEYLRCLESRVMVLESQNKCLMDELRALKQLYRLQ